ncbi:MAG: tetratricopeptide repeat protein, partial [Anaerolineae bacterium]
LGRLSVFRAGFDHRAAREVAGIPPSLLDALAARSLLEEVVGHRYAMHALLQRFAAEKLASSPPDLEEMEARHGAYYATWMRQQEEALHGEGQQEALRAVGREIGNVRAAWEGAIASRRFPVVEHLLRGLGRFYDVRGWLHEGRDAFARAAGALAGEDGRALGRLLVRQAWFSFRLGLYDEARELGEKSLSLLDRTGNAGDRAFACLVLGGVADEQGEYQEARVLLEQSLALYQQAGDRWNLARTHDRLGDLARMVGDYDSARQHYEQCLALYTASGGRAGIARALNSLGSDAGTRGDYGRARAFFEQSLAICREIDDRFGIAGACHNLGNLAYVQGDYAGAKRLRQETLTICRQIGFRWGVADSLRHLGDARRKLGEYDEARHLLLESLVLKREISHQRGIVLALSSLGDLFQDTGELDQSRRYYCQALQVAQEIGALPVTLSILAGWGQLLARQDGGEPALEILAFVLHHPAAEKQTRDRAAEVYAALAPTLPSAAAAGQRGPERTLEEIVGMLLA